MAGPVAAGLADLGGVRSRGRRSRPTTPPPAPAEGWAGRWTAAPLPCSLGGLLVAASAELVPTGAHVQGAGELPLQFCGQCAGGGIQPGRIAADCGCQAVEEA